MEVVLKDVTLENFEEVTDLKVRKKQRDYVASNLYSIAESKFYPSYRPRAIYLGDKVVGFLMYESMESENKPNEYDIFRFMVDKKYQGRGIGRKAMELALKEIKDKGFVERITICYVPSNPVARDFYGSFGFVEIGLDEEGEMIAEIRV